MSLSKRDLKIFKHAFILCVESFQGCMIASHKDAIISPL